MSKNLKSVIVLLVGVALVYLFFRQLDWQTVGAHLREANPWLIVAGVIMIYGTLVARSLRWQVLLAPIKKVSLRNAFAANTIGFGSIFVFGRAGEVVRPIVMSLRERLSPGATIATVFIERIFDTAAVVALFAGNLLFFVPPENQAGNSAVIRSIRLTGLSLSLGVIAGLGLLVLLRLKADVFLAWMGRITRPLPQKVSSLLLGLLRHLAEGLSVLVNLKELLLAIFYTALVWGTVTAAAWLVVRAFGVDFSLGYIVFLLGFGLVGSAVPTPGGGAGAFHVATQRALMFLGLETNLAAAIAVVFHLVSFGPPFLLSFYFLVRDDIRLSQLREMMTPDHPAT